MKPEQSIAIMKALADESRLAITNSLLERDQYVEELAERHGLAPSTVSFHLKKLEQAGLVSSRKEQYYVVVRANESIFDTTLREIVSAPPAGKELQDGRMEGYRRKVLDSFFLNGRLQKLPAQHKKRLIVLEQFAARFQPEHSYTEQEVTGLIMPLFDDYCTIRRLLVDEGMIDRDGTTYRRRAAAGVPAQPVISVGDKGADAMKKDTGRTEIKRLYKQNAPDMGVYQIRNRENGKIYLGTSRNLAGTRNGKLFELRMGKAVYSKDLQQDLSRYGADSFEFSVVAVLDRPEPGESVDQALLALELHWMEKLQPFGEQGYNSKAAYRRNTERLRQGSGEETL